MADEIRILIADDHVLVREGTRKILEHEHDLKIVAEAGDGEEAVRLTAELAPDVAIIDINMPKLDGIEVTKQVKALCPQTKVLILSAYDEYQFVLRLLECGADGYLLKSVRGNELVEAVRS
ncbi:MAG: response regulator transcription factor, partial [Dehalococcoidia bacterium]|nr:response regulator transcription factor [Dehalococcoidia bacterium]